MAMFNKVPCSLVVALVICFVGGFMMSGCNAGGGSSGGTEEYKVVRETAMGTDAETENILNKYGKEGWKLRAFNGNEAVLARSR
jgi:hypothetical protein